MPGFNDQQRGRGCILAAAEQREGRRNRWRWRLARERGRDEGKDERKRERERERGGGGRRRRKKKERDRQITPGAKRQEAKNCAPSDLPEAPGGSGTREPPMVSVIGGH